MDLSVVILNWNTMDLLIDCLKAIDDTFHAPAFEVIVVDNASTDGSVDAVRQSFPGVRLIQNSENVGFARANNRAIRECRGRYILLLNSDAFVAPGAMTQLLQAMEADPQIGIAGANLFYPDGRPQSSHGQLPSLQSEVRSLFGLDKRLRGAFPDSGALPFIGTGYVEGACLMVRRQMFDQIGLLDERFYFYSEEIDLCYRAHQAGWKVVHVPSARVVHIGGGSAGPTANRYLMLYKAKLTYFAKHYGDRTSRLYFISIWCSTVSKIFIFTLLRWLGLRREKDTLWRNVARGLSNINP